MLRRFFIMVLLALPLTGQAALLMHLTLDNTLNDASGNGNNGSFPGGSRNPVYAPAAINEGLNFDGNNDYITASDFDPGSNFTVSLWVRPDSSSDLDAYIEHVRTNQRNDFFLGYDNAYDQIIIELEDTNQFEGGACGDPKFCTGVSLSPNRWHHLTVTVTPTTLTLYVDGEQAYSVSHGTTVTFNPGIWMMGGDSDSNPNSVANSDYFDGRLDDIRVYNEVLDQEDISELTGLRGWWKLDECSLASPGDVIDSSGNGNNGSPVNGATVSSGKICNGGSFDGSNDYIEVPDDGSLDIRQYLTVMAWIRPDIIPASGLKSIVSKDENYEFHINSAGRIYWWWQNSGGTVRSFTSTTTLSAGSWYHVAIVYEPGSQRILINGVERGSRSYNENLINNNDPLHIGADQYFAGREFDGLIDEVKIFERALTTEEINDYYNRPDPIGRNCPSCSGGGAASNIILSTDRTETLGGLTFSDGSLAEYDPNTDSATLFFNENLFGGNEDIDAVHVQANGTIILSTTGNATLGGLSFSDGDLVAYDPATDSTTLFFDENLFSANEDIDAVYVMSNGNILLSTTGTATLGGLTFSDGSLVEYNPVTDSASLYFSESLFAGGADIDGVHVLDSGNILITTTRTETLGGLTFSDGSIAEYNPGSNTATLYFNENLFSGGADVNAITIQPPAVQIDHFLIEHDGSALTCEPESVTLRACADAACTTLYTGNVSVTLSPSGWVGGDTQIITGGSATLQLRRTTAGAVSLDVVSSSPAQLYSTACLNTADSSSSCSLTFYDTGFIYSIPTQTSCVTSANITVSAVRLDQASQQCVPSFANRNETINFWSRYVNPATGGNSVTLNNGSADYVLATASPGTGVPLSFDANGEAIITVSYPDAGQLNLNSQFNGSGTESGLVMNGSASYVVKPAKFNVQTAASCSTGDVNCPLFTTAGSGFGMTVSAACADNTLTPNFVHNNISLSLNLIAPIPGVTGNLGVSALSITSGGQTVINNQSITEVGVFTVTARLAAGTNYLGETVIGDDGLNTSLNIGRFYPASFDVSRLQSCNTDNFTYSAQPFTVYATALNSLGNTTQNYRDTFVRAPLVSDSSGDSSLFSNNVFDSSNFILGDGTRTDVTYTFAAKDSPPTDVTLQVSDSDGVTGTGPQINVRSGRLNIENAFGSELADLAMPVTVQYFDGSGYVRNTLDNNCSSISLSLSDPDGSDALVIGNGGSAGQTCIWDDAGASGSNNCSAGGILPGPVSAQFAEPPQSGDFNAWLKAPGAGYTGNIDMIGSAPLWLQYDWTGTGLSNPDGRASFGLFRGDDRIIYWREQF